MMQAVLNGLTGVGWIVDGDSAFVLRVDSDRPLPATRFDLPHVIGEGRDIDFVNVTDAGEALEILRRSHVRQESLDLALILLDGDLSRETRAEAAAVLGNKLLDWDLRFWLEGVLFAAPLPSEADMDGAIGHASEVGGPAARSMLSRLSDLQTVIRRVHEAWTSVCARVLSSAAARNQVTVLATRNGVFRHLVHASEGSKEAYDEFRFAALRALQTVPDHRRIVEELVLELQFLPINRKVALPPPAEEDLTHRVPDETRKDAQRLSFDRTAAFENVKRQKDAIVNHMRAARFDLVQRYVDELIDFQLPLDHRGEHTSKSLCDLAMEAKSLGLFELQLALASRAVTLRYQDGWAWAQVGDASLILNRFDDALSAYRHAGEFAGNQVGRTGYAHVLLRMGRLEDSLHAFDEVIRDYPVATFAMSGRAEALKSMGQLDEALAAYDAVIRDFPTDIVAKTGRAEVLKSMGQLDEALAAYDAVIRDFPTSTVAKNGRAEVLKFMGQLDEALAAYDAVIRDFPTDIVAKTGRAEVLKSMGQLDEALAAYDAVIRDFPTSTVAKNGRAEVLKSMGQLDEALAAYDAVIRDFPTNIVAKTGRAEVLKSMGQLDDALAAYETVLKKWRHEPVAANGRTAVLCALGRYDEAISSVPSESPRTRQEWIALHIRGMAMLRAKRIDEASNIFARGSQENPFAADRDVFRSGLALARLHQRAYDAALNILSEVREIGSARVAAFLRGHSAGALGDQKAAAKFLSATGAARNHRERELKAELERRFVKSEVPLHDDEWLIQNEMDCMLLAA